MISYDICAFKWDSFLFLRRKFPAALVEKKYVTHNQSYTHKRENKEIYIIILIIILIDLK